MFVTRNQFFAGHWEVIFEQEGFEYEWELSSRESKEGKREQVIVTERLARKGETVPLIERSESELRLLGQNVPRLSGRDAATYVFKEAEEIKPAYTGFGSILERRFDYDALRAVYEFQTVPMGLQEEIAKERNLNPLYRAGLHLSTNLFFLQAEFPGLYRQVQDDFRRVFPFVEEMRITDLSKLDLHVPITGQIPVVTVREQGSKAWVSAAELSSGMQKVLLIMTDVCVMPEGGVYLIDEYENSLGLSAINFFPDFVNGMEKKMQFIVTSHHPYLINQFPPSQWYVVHREGVHVQVRQGEANAAKYGKSKQDVFTQLINDPFYRRGSE